MMDFSKAKNLLKGVDCSDYVQLKSMATEQLDELENAVKTIKLQRQQKNLLENDEPLINNQPKEIEAGFHKCALTELKSLPNPPEVVKKTLSAFMLILGHPETDAKKWQRIQVFMGNQGAILIQCKDIQIQDISKKQAKLAAEVLKDCESSERVKQVSCAAALIHQWTTEVLGKVLHGR